MGVAELRTAFNDIAEPAGFSCAKAELSYTLHEGVQWQILTFRGTDANGAAFVSVSERLRPETDVVAAAKQVATKMIVPEGGNG